MRALLIVLAGVGVLIAGCAAPVKLRTEIFQDQGKIDSLTVGRFTTKNPVDGELIEYYLRIELVNRGFDVNRDSPYILSGAIGFGFYGGKAVISLRNREGDILQTWFCECEVFFSGWQRCMTGKEFAFYISDEISQSLKE